MHHGYDSARVAGGRAAKDAALRDPGSPIPDDLRTTFTGLRYYPIDSSYAFWLKLEPFEHPDTVRMAATGGDVRTMVRYGTFRFTIDGTACALVAYMMPEHSRSIFVPFKDATNGSETYEVGRYLDLDLEPTGVFLIDFNAAYNPYCAYNARYTCPLVPRENILPVAVRAGEKLPGFAAN